MVILILLSWSEWIMTLNKKLRLSIYQNIFNVTNNIFWMDQNYYTVIKSLAMKKYNFISNMK